MKRGSALHPSDFISEAKEEDGGRAPTANPGTN
jgi:hypothetical protein